jgi:hypothetical protein
MRSILTAGAMLAALTGAALAQGYGANPSDHYVNGYTTSRGTEVQPHYQTNPNSTTYDNYGTRGNYNPHTGAYGTHSPY